MELFLPFTSEGNNVLQKDGFFRKREERRDDSLFRPGQPATPATVPAAAAYAAPAPLSAEKGEERKEAKLVVGPDIKMKGAEITDCDTLVVEGRMEATLDSRVLEIAQNGVFQGTIAVDNAEINGRFEGELTVRKQLTIHGTGKVSGKIRYAKIKIEEGAELAGEISVLDKSQSSVATTRRVGVALTN
jgi:cytoskeletal protein CcmA (bactofilin family)